MDDPGAIVGAVGGSGAALSVVGWFVRQAFKDNRDAIAKLTATVEKLREEQGGAVGRVAVLEAGAVATHKENEKAFAMTHRLIEEVGKRVARLEDRDERPSGEKRRIR